MDSLRCLSSKQVIFLNLTGSGNETAAHLAENRGEAGLQIFWNEKNQESIDGLPTYLLEHK
jgi:hypothetical protein